MHATLAVFVDTCTLSVPSFGRKLTSPRRTTTINTTTTTTNTQPSGLIS
jgi:hypothetical protein